MVIRGQSEGTQMAISGHHLQWREEPRELWKRSVGRTLIKGRLSDATIERGREIGGDHGAIRGYSEGTQRVLRGYLKGNQRVLRGYSELLKGELSSCAIRGQSGVNQGSISWQSGVNQGRAVELRLHGHTKASLRFSETLLHSKLDMAASSEAIGMQ